MNLELQQCQDALEDQQRRLEDVLVHRDNLGKQLQDYQAALIECRENIDFLQMERGTTAEAYQESEMLLQATKAEMLIEKSKANELMDRARKLYAKVKDKKYVSNSLRIHNFKPTLTCDSWVHNCLDYSVSISSTIF